MAAHFKLKNQEITFVIKQILTRPYFLIYYSYPLVTKDLK